MKDGIMSFSDLLQFMLKTGTNYQEITLAATVTPVFPDNKNRLAIMFSPPTSGSALYKPQNSTTLNGFRLGTSSNPIVLSVWQHGHIVQEAWFGVHSAGAVDVAVAEVISLL